MMSNGSTISSSRLGRLIFFEKQTFVANALETFWHQVENLHIWNACIPNNAYNAFFFIVWGMVVLELSN